MEKTKNCWLIPTDKPSRLHLGKSGLVLCDWIFNRTTINAQNIYITSDELPKLNEWGINLKNNVVFKCKGFTPDEYDKKYCKKVIMTTDEQLIRHGVQAIDDVFLEFFVKNPSCKEVETETIDDSGWNYGYKIIIPKEEPKKECKHDIVIKYGVAECQNCGIEVEPKQETIEEDDTISDYDITPNIIYGNNVGQTIKLKATIKSINIEDAKRLNGVCEICNNSVVHLGEKLYVEEGDKVIPESLNSVPSEFNDIVDKEFFNLVEKADTLDHNETLEEFIKNHHKNEPYWTETEKEIATRNIKLGVFWQQKRDSQEIQDLKDRLDTIRKINTNIINLIKKLQTQILK